MASAKTFILKNTSIDVVVKIVADNTTTNTTTFLPASGFVAAAQTQTLPVSLGIKGITFSAPGGVEIYRGTGQTTVATNVVFSGSGNGTFQQSAQMTADYDTVQGDITVVLPTYGTVYLHLSKVNGYTATFNPEQAGYLAG